MFRNFKKKGGHTMLKNWGMLMLLVGMILPALANEPEAIIINGHSMMPLRYVSETFGAGIQYNSGTKQVDFAIGYQKTTMTVGSKTARVDNKVVILDEAPVMVAGVTYVPARFVSVVIGATIYVDSDHHVCMERKGKKLSMGMRHHNPPGLAKKGGIPPGLAKKHGIPPGHDSHMKGDTPPSPDFHNMKGKTPEHRIGTQSSKSNTSKNDDMRRGNDDNDKKDKSDKKDKKDKKGKK